ncbi:MULTISPECIES: phosphomannomutase/phosphoglucomutase [Aeromonas]|uniref:phosphomannomutase n=1 Tax=Aeromonas media TaxID=651 RepID=A0A6M4YE32_AERME|nr:MULTISPECIES: phosphomannomutase/phosphoglucomutase [Aeromonas]HDT6077814.1 phosphomannomutase/phosphoglucomutase [Aeromonas veronii bv. veronii]MDE8809122.1 phosphomannomutase/phosphoglucomutase [Aeromonas hydrophila]MDO2948067.1 phosphomannomutase/phosphoglucomutase [Aeromonas simiae]MDO2953101.1 phosphomannomutase/phosphoglucomutase [Aeromonas simiae]MDO2955514.1 phosphomannomutase/phosphoglucomutase [Aeromonas simiae]
MFRSMTCFKAYDIRGRLGEELDEEVAYRIGRAYAQLLQPRGVVVGGDARHSSAALKAALARGLMEGGADVHDLGLAGTEEVYFATFHLGLDGGIEVTASHNPIDYNGMKLVREQSRPISGDSGLDAIRALAESGEFAPAPRQGCYHTLNVLDAYVDHLLGYIDVATLRPLKLVINSGNGAAGHVVEALARRLRERGAPLDIHSLLGEPDGDFPHGIPNPLLPECREQTRRAVLELGADLGIAFDGDFDRCFLFDDAGNFIEGYYIVGLLAEAFLLKEPGARIIHDPRLCWNTEEIVRGGGGVPVLSKTGHAFIKERMREEDAIYGGEMSAHHYFRDFAYCDSGMIPWLLVVELVSRRGLPLKAMLAEQMAAFPASGEINRKLENSAGVLAAIERAYGAEAWSVDRTDGLSMSFGHWRFNLRSSNTEPLIRLNVESRGDRALMEAKTAELLAMLEPVPQLA